MSKSRFFVWASISFAVGVGLRSVVDIPPTYIMISAFFCLVVFSLAFYLRKTQVAALALICMFAPLGIWRMAASEQKNEFAPLFETTQKIEGVVIEDVDIRTDKQLVTLKPNNSTQYVLLTTTLSTEFKYGDQVVVEGKLREPKNFSDFNYKGYLERYGVYGVMQYPKKALILKSGKGNLLVHLLLGVKELFTRRVKSLLPSPQDDLLLGILIGAKKTLPPALIEYFNTTGTSHIVAISGFNITIIIGALGSLAKLIGRRLSFWISIFLLVSFVIIAGASASVVRATVMGFLLLIGMNIGRQYSVVPALFFAGFIMLLHNPKVLYFDIGFQLSFAATLGIVVFMPVLERLTEAWPKLWQFKSILLTTLAAIVSTLPLTLLYFDRLSIVAPLANILVLPLLPFAMLFGFLSIVPILGPGFGFVADIILQYTIRVVEILAQLPFSSTEMSIKVWMAVLMYIFVAALYWGLRKLSRRLPVRPVSDVERALRMW
jgi:competence protein ComEC